MFTYENKRPKLLVYTRKPCENSYPAGLAYSVHLASSRDGVHFQALHQNYGILFAEAEIDARDRIVPRGAAMPFVFALPEGGFAIGAKQVDEDGNERHPKGMAGGLLIWKTKDFISFDEPIWVRQEQFAENGPYGKLPIEKTGQYFLGQETVQGCIIEIDAGLCDRIERKWNQAINTQICLPDSIVASSVEEVEKVQARAVYSDGSAAMKKVCWDTRTVDFGKPGIYKVQGTVCNKKYTFPLARGYGDPVIFPWNGKWYFLGTSDNRGDIGIYIRVADTVEGLFAEGVMEHLILGPDEGRGFVQTFWAPEFHVIGSRAYILFAVSGQMWGPQCHLMRLKEGGCLTEADGWEEPVRILRKDQSPLSEDGITLDMTYVDTGKCSYMVWSYRKNIGTPEDTGSMLMIAGVDAQKPWQLAGEPVLLSRPLYGWENVSGTVNNEGPHAFIKGSKVYLTYSGGAANGYTYALGLLTADADADLTDVSSWSKSKTPVLSFYSVEGEYGPGHNSFYVDVDGDLMIAYHAETTIESRLRCDGIRRVHFDLDGEPVFDMPADKDLDPALSGVSMQVVVR